MKVKRYQSFILLLAAAACFLFFQLKFRYHFFFVERSSLFVLSQDFLSGYFVKPAWSSCMAGDFLQQLYHYPVLGPLTLSVLLLVLGLFSLRSFNAVFAECRSGFLKNVMPVVLAAAVMFVEARLNIYENARLASLVSLLGGFLMWNVCSRAKWWAFGLGSLLCCWCFGYGFAVMLLLELLRCILQKRIPAGFVCAAALCAGLGFAASKPCRMITSEFMMYPGAGQWVDMRKEAGVDLLLAYDTEYARGNYARVIEMYEKAKYPRIKEMGFFYAMSASQFGLLPDKLRNIKDPMIGPFVHVGEKSSLFLIEMMGEFYYLIGDMTYAERVSMHANSFTPSKCSPRLLQRLVMINLVTGDDKAALKYLRILEKSPIYRCWALDHNPASPSPEVQREIDAKRPFVNNHDVIHVGDNCHTILTGLLDSNKGNVVALDYMLCSDFMAGEKAMFYNDYKKYGPRDKELYNRLLKSRR